jgi:hypothetical protein
MNQKHKIPDQVVLAAKWKLIKEDLAAAGVRVLTKNRRQRVGVIFVEPTLYDSSLVIDVSEDLYKLSDKQKEYVRLAQKRAREYVVEDDDVLQRHWHQLLDKHVEVWLQTPLDEELKAAKRKVSKVRRKTTDRQVATVEGALGSEAAPPPKRVRGPGKETKEQKAHRLQGEKLNELLNKKLEEHGLISKPTDGRSTPTLSTPVQPRGP